MKESHGEGVAIHSDPESCAVVREDGSEALTGARAGQVLSRETDLTSGRRRPYGRRKATPTASPARDAGRPRRLHRVRQAERKDRKQRFTALLHHVYDVARLRTAYFALKREAAAGVDGETWRHYGEALEENLHDLSERLKRGAYRAKPV